MFRPALVLLAAFTALLGVAYPAAVTGLAQLLFPRAANGSVVVERGAVAGSALVGQPFSSPRYFWGRPSATTPVAYDGRASSGSDLGPSSPALAERVAARVAALRAAGPDRDGPVPVDLVTASGSGLDPDISVAAALYQVERVARARGLDPARVRALVDRHAQGRVLGVLGAPRVNVLALNLSLDAVER
jgi:K+-transporting ATPase ATPase C chain